MADQKRWFKVWTSILSDDDFDPEIEGILGSIGRFVLLGSYAALHGTRGRFEIRKRTLFRLMQHNNLDAIRAEIALRNVTFEEGKNDNDKIIVTLLNWTKYQIDSTLYERQKKYRKQQNDNGTRGDKKRGDKKRGEIPPIVPRGDVADVMQFLNEKTGKNFLVTTNGTQKLTTGAERVRDRLKDGFSVQDCRTVIANRVLKWGGDDKMKEHLTPETLFRKSNFEKYYGGLNWTGPE